MSEQTRRIMERYKELEQMARDSYCPYTPEQIRSINMASWTIGNEHDIQERIRTFALLRDIDEAPKGR